MASGAGSRIRSLSRGSNPWLGGKSPLQIGDVRGPPQKRPCPHRSLRTRCYLRLLPALRGPTPQPHQPHGMAKRDVPAVRLYGLLGPRIRSPRRDSRSTQQVHRVHGLPALQGSEECMTRGKGSDHSAGSRQGIRFRMVYLPCTKKVSTSAGLRPVSPKRSTFNPQDQ